MFEILFAFAMFCIGCYAEHEIHMARLQRKADEFAGRFVA